MNIFLLFLFSIEIPNNIFYLKINSFGQYDYLQAEDAIYLRLAQSEKIDGIILDLRDNPGGSLIFTRRLCEFWIPAGKTIFKVIYLNDSIEYYYSRNFAPPFKDIPTIILVNRRTASAAEIVALSLRCYHRAFVIGQRTAGHYKIKMVNVGKGIMELTIGYWIVKDISIRNKGVELDLLVADTEKQLEIAVEYLQRGLKK